jgi:hypothetical protein
MQQQIAKIAGVPALSGADGQHTDQYCRRRRYFRQPTWAGVQACSSAINDSRQHARPAFVIDIGCPDELLEQAQLVVGVPES